MNNISSLTRSHRAIAGKKRARKAQVKEVLFDDDARREFLTGFHKRNLAKKEEGKRRREEREKAEHKQLRRESRQELAERAVQNARDVERAYGGGNDEAEWGGAGSGSDAGDSGREEEYEGEEQLATVTVVEDFDPATLIYGPPTPSRRAGIPEEDATEGKTKGPSKKPIKDKKAKAAPAKAAKAKANTRVKEVKYQTMAARRAEKRKQLARHTEKAERAGGKQERKRPKGRR